MDNRLTVLVTLKDRAELTPRFCKYLSRIKFPFMVMFADGSVGDENERFLKSYEKEASFTYKYIKYPTDKSYSDFYKKCKLASQNVTTPYIVLADNDDFPIIDGLVSAVDFLESNSDFIGCVGLVGGLICDNNKNAVFLTLYDESHKPKQYDNDSTIDRFKNFIVNDFIIYYGVFRTKAMIKTQATIAEIDFKDISIHEIFFHLMMLLQGKVSALHKWSYVRQKGTSQFAATVQDWFHRIFMGTWFVDLHTAIDYIVGELIKDENDNNAEELRQEIYSALAERKRKRWIPNKLYIFKNLTRLLEKNLWRERFTPHLLKLAPSFVAKISHNWVRDCGKQEDLNNIVATILEE